MKDHIPVLIKEVLKYLDPKRNENFIDATINGGGHAKEILKKIKPGGMLLGIDRDQELIKKLKLEVKDRGLMLVNSNFRDLKEVVSKNNFKDVSGILFDLGMSSWQLEKSKRGFSFRNNEILDMRLDFSQELRAVDVINKWQEKDIEEIIKNYGEERWARKIAEEIIKERKIKPIIETDRLANIVKRSVPSNYERGRIHPATRTFQALRIEINQEIESLKSALPGAVEVLKPGGKIAIISFHSLEDRIVKNFFREESKENIIKTLTKKPIAPTDKEININPRARSAKLRVCEKLK